MEIFIHSIDVHPFQSTGINLKSCCGGYGAYIDTFYSIESIGELQIGDILYAIKVILDDENINEVVVISSMLEEIKLVLKETNERVLHYRLAFLRMSHNEIHDVRINSLYELSRKRPWLRKYLQEQFYTPTNEEESSNFAFQQLQTLLEELSDIVLDTMNNDYGVKSILAHFQLSVWYQRYKAHYIFAILLQQTYDHTHDRECTMIEIIQNPTLSKYLYLYLIRSKCDPHIHQQLLQLSQLPLEPHQQYSLATQILESLHQKQILPRFYQSDLFILLQFDQYYSYNHTIDIKNILDKVYQSKQRTLYYYSLPKYISIHRVVADTPLSIPAIDNINNELIACSVTLQEGKIVINHSSTNDSQTEEILQCLLPSLAPTSSGWSIKHYLLDKYTTTTLRTNDSTRYMYICMAIFNPSQTTTELNQTSVSQDNEHNTNDAHTRKWYTQFQQRLQLPMMSSKLENKLELLSHLVKGHLYSCYHDNSSNAMNMSDRDDGDDTDIVEISMHAPTDVEYKERINCEHINPMISIVEGTKLTSNSTIMTTNDEIINFDDEDDDQEDMHSFHAVSSLIHCVISNQPCYYQLEDCLLHYIQSLHTVDVDQTVDDFPYEMIFDYIHNINHLLCLVFAMILECKVVIILDSNEDSDIAHVLVQYLLKTIAPFQWSYPVVTNASDRASVDKVLQCPTPSLLVMNSSMYAVDGDTVDLHHRDHNDVSSKYSELLQTFKSSFEATNDNSIDNENNVDYIRYHLHSDTLVIPSTEITADGVCTNSNEKLFKLLYMIQCTSLRTIISKNHRSLLDHLLYVVYTQCVPHSSRYHLRQLQVIQQMQNIAKDDSEVDTIGTSSPIGSDHCEDEYVRFEELMLPRHSYVDIVENIDSFIRLSEATSNNSQDNKSNSFHRLLQAWIRGVLLKGAELSSFPLLEAQIGGGSNKSKRCGVLFNEKNFLAIKRLQSSLFNKEKIHCMDNHITMEDEDWDEVFLQYLLRSQNLSNYMSLL